MLRCSVILFFAAALLCCASLSTSTRAGPSDSSVGSRDRLLREAGTCSAVDNVVCKMSSASPVVPAPAW